MLLVCCACVIASCLGLTNVGGNDSVYESTPIIKILKSWTERLRIKLSFIQLFYFGKVNLWYIQELLQSSLWSSSFSLSLISPVLIWHYRLIQAINLLFIAPCWDKERHLFLLSLRVLYSCNLLNKAVTYRLLQSFENHSLLMTVFSSFLNQW